MPELSYSNILVLILAAMLIWVSINVLLAIAKINRTYQLTPSRFIYPANNKPEDCKDVVGFISFMTPRLVGFSVMGLLIAAFILVNELTSLFAALPGWFTQGAVFFLFIPIFIWYVIFINKAARKFW